MKEKPSRVELVACFASDLSAGLRGGIEQVNVSFTHQELFPEDVAELCSFFKEFLNADAVVTKEAYDADTKRQNKLLDRAAKESL
jgi:hypothetical protein